MSAITRVSGARAQIVSIIQLRRSCAFIRAGGGDAGGSGGGGGRYSSLLSKSSSQSSSADQYHRQSNHVSTKALLQPSP